MKTIVALVLPLTCALLLLTGGSAEMAPGESPLLERGNDEEDAEVDFGRDILPLISDRCYFCHGPDEENREGGFRLDLEEEALDFIDPGDAEASLMFERIISDDPDEVMPPPRAKVPLSEEEKELIRRWIDSGAQWSGHWAFDSPAAADVPQLDGDAWSVNEIDRFVLRRLREEQLTPSEKTSRERLIRRVTFDLTGLPPTIEEIEQFTGDESPEAYEKVVDRLLESDRFGERVAANWLDIARYSDSYGYQVDRDRFVWPWRDWVVRAINANMPYDEFITKQLAGDLLPEATSDDILATTFSRLHPQKVEGGSVEEEFRVEYVADRTQTAATAFMGLTWECARCHDHKFDPISQRDYYGLYSFFNNIDEAGLYSFFTNSIPTPNLLLIDEAQQKKLDELQAAVDEAERQLQQVVSDEREAALTWIADGAGLEEEIAGRIANVDFATAGIGGNERTTGPEEGVHAVKLTGDDEVRLDGIGNLDRFEPFTISTFVNTPDEKERAVIFHRSRAWTDAASRGYELLIVDGYLQASLIHFWPGNAISVRSKEKLPVGEWTQIAMSYDGSNRADGIAIWMNGERMSVDIVRDNLTKTVRGGGNDFITIGARFRDRGFKDSLVSRFNVFDRQLSAIEISELCGSTEAADASEDLLREHFVLAISEPVKDAREKLKAAREALCRHFDGLKEIMVMREMSEVRPAYVLDRGAYDAPRMDEPVSPLTPEALPEMAEDLPRNRLGLAMWLTEPEHPLTSRVAVNRLWQLVFGQGLVRTPEDFGRQGAAPTHPELLDWLATDFVSNGWDTKRLIKQMVMSATYQQSSRTSAEMFELDPENELLARANSYRMPAEMLRDNVLFVSGLLVEKAGGAPVKPYDLDQSFKPVASDSGEGVYRRSLYTYWNRTGPSPLLTAFDAAKRDVCTVERERTSSPIQALVMLNSPQFVEASRALSLSMMGEVAGDDDKTAIASRMFLVLTSRNATAEEIDVIGRLYERQKEIFAADAEATRQFIGTGHQVVPDDVDPVELAAWTNVALTLFSYDESVTRR
ncbi:MAG: DUF1553 domain-containing protein [Planctomycetota bacterium]